MRDQSDEIRELALLDDIAAISTNYENAYGASPINLSSWNPNSRFFDHINLGISPVKRNAIDYIFSYDIEFMPSIISRYSDDTQPVGCLITHSGSSAIVSVCNWLRSKGCKNVLIVGPRYFTVPYCLKVNGIDCSICYVERHKSGFGLPSKFTTIEYDAIWVTSPVYCTSVYFSQDDISVFLEKFCRNRILILDECLAEPGRNITFNPSLPSSFCRIISPHKTICVNAMKFGAVLFPLSEQGHFDSWSDVWHGCVPQSAYWAAEHFLSPAFEKARSDFRQLITHSFADLRNIVAEFENIQIDINAYGYLVNVYFPEVPAIMGYNMDFITEATMQSGAIFIPSIRNEMPYSVGFAFRINLAAFDAEAQGALFRLCAWLNQFTTNPHQERESA